MDKQTSIAIDYYIEYETHDRLNSVAFKNSNSTTISIKNLNSIEYIKANLKKRKKEHVKKEIDYLIKDKKSIEDIATKILNINIENTKDLRQEVLDILSLHVEKINKLVQSKVDELASLLSNDVINVFYPICRINDKRFALIAAYCEIVNNELRVQEHKISEDLLNLLMKKKCYKTLEEYFGSNKEKADFFKVLNSLNNPNVKELGDLVVEEINKAIPDLKVEINNKNMHGAIITTEELGDAFFPPFKDELHLLKNLLKDQQSPLIEKYLSTYKEQKSVDELSCHSHFGSYTNEYSVNEKQWKVVNAIRDNQLISVTGPPGTGKTTVLKEVIADSFVEKTKNIIEHWDGEWKKISTNSINIFQSPHGGKNPKSIIVTSTNNEAVDNIGKEITKEISYLVNDKSIVSSFCARLGKKENVDEFDKDVLQKKIELLEECNDLQEDDVKSQIKKFHEIYDEIKNYNNLVKEYQNIKEEIKTKYFKDDKVISFHFVSKEETLTQESINDLNLKISQIKQDIESCDKQIEEITKNKYSDNEQLGKAKTRRQLHVIKKEKHEKISNLFIIGKVLASIIYGDINVLNQEIENIESQIQDISDAIKRREIRINDIEKDQKELIKKIKEIEEDIEIQITKQNDLKRYLKKYNEYKNTLDEMKTGETPDSVEFNIFNNKTILEKRHELFNLSLSINEKYVYKNRDKIVKNLRYVREGETWFKSFYSSDFKYNQDKEVNIRTVWETFCLCFPVVTTTLHSLERSKIQMIKELFDTLLVDEAGQGLPYYLLSPLYRVKNAMIVGDELQLQPIRKSRDNVFSKYEKDLPIHLNADTSSAQTLANEASNVYELLRDKKAGIILTEHRRCEKSIAAFSNKYVYDNKMFIHKIDTEKEVLQNNLCFIDIRGEKSESNVNLSEVRTCKGVVKELLTYYRSDDIGIITPYRGQRLEIEKNFDDNIKVGTVHSFQGQEKEVIILSMVVSSTKDRSGQRFLGGAPNFLNVAFTRAKQQLIIIGNYELLENAERGNYLYDVNASIKEYGRVYSIYDENNLDSINEKYLNQFYRILTDDNGMTQSAKYHKLFGQYTNAGGLIIDSDHYKLLLNLFDSAEKQIQIVEMGSGLTN